MAAAIESKGWLAAHKWLLLRRLSQVVILALFLSGAWFGIWIAKGNLSYSYTLNFLPLTDPYLMLQGVLAGQRPERIGLIGVAIVLVFYLLVGGRVYCAWVCPVNAVTDISAWLRRKLGLKGSAHVSRRMRFWILGMTLVLSVVTGTIAWEMVNPVSMLHRGLFFGFGLAWAVVLAVFLFDLFVVNRGWCGHLCPVGAFYSLLGRWRLPRVSARQRAGCDDCMDCFVVCPEPSVIKIPLKGEGSPVIASSQCTSCGRCIDVCSKNVFVFTSNHLSKHEVQIGAAAPK